MIDIRLTNVSLTTEHVEHKHSVQKAHTPQGGGFDFFDLGPMGPRGATIGGPREGCNHRLDVGPKQGDGLECRPLKGSKY